MQSVWLVIVESELPVPLEEPDGLADGEEPVEPGDEGEPDDEGADIEPLLEPEPVAPVLPLPPVLLPELPAPELPAPLLEPPAPAPLPAPPPAAPPPARTSAGVKVIIPIKSKVSIFFIRVLLANKSETLALFRGGLSNIQAPHVRLTAS